MRWFAPEHDWSWLKPILARLRGRAVPVRDKRARLRSAHELLALGHQLMQAAVTATGPSLRQRARLYRDGLMIAFLAARPLRLANLTQLELGRELIQRPSGWWLEIPGTDTKTGQPLELPFPEDLVPALKLYLGTWRPRLARPERSAANTALWLSHRGNAVSDIHAYNLIMAHTRATFGQPVNPHLFRDVAATTVALERPEQVRITARLLGHASFATTERYYNLARGTEAARAWHAVLEGIAGED